jgi:hypothetical protein
MHPGNLFIGAGGQLIAMDFGIMGRVDKRTRRFLGEMLLGFLSGDYRKVAEVHFAAGFVTADQSMAFTQACRSIAEPILGRPLHEISIAKLLGQLFQVTETFAMETQPQLLLLQKSMLVAEGVGRILDPHINMWHLAQPLIEGWMRENLGPEARVRETVTSVVGSLERLPRLLAETEKTYAMLVNQGLKLHRHGQAMFDRAAYAALALLAWIIAAGLAVALSEIEEADRAFRRAGLVGIGGGHIWVAQHVASSPHRLDVGFAARGGGQLLPELADEDVDDLQLGLVDAAIEVVEELLLGQGLALAERQQFQDAVFLGGRVQRLASGTRRWRVQVDRQLAGVDHRLGGPGAPDDGLDADHALVERLVR